MANFMKILFFIVIISVFIPVMVLFFIGKALALLILSVFDVFILPIIQALVYSWVYLTSAITGIYNELFKNLEQK